jgi:hypothetical protein
MNKNIRIYLPLYPHLPDGDLFSNSSLERFLLLLNILTSSNISNKEIPIPLMKGLIMATLQKFYSCAFPASLAFTMN